MKVHIGPYRKNRKVSIKIDDYDLWNLDITLALVIHPALVKFRAQLDDENLLVGYPSEFSPPNFREDGINYGGFGGGVEAWKEVLDKMIEAFKLVIDGRSDTKNNVEDYKKTEEKIQEGLYLFSKYYRGLWD